MNLNAPSLKQIAADTANGGRFSYLLGDFLDAFYRAPLAEALAPEPELLQGAVPKGEVWDAFLAATAEHLARRYHFRIPSWTNSPSRQLRHPYFPIEAPQFRATLLLESPVEFRSRNLFVTANALSRA
jgi:hypothetical protein